MGYTSTKHHSRPQQAYSNCPGGALHHTWLCMEKQLVSSQSIYNSCWKAQSKLQCLQCQKLANGNQSTLSGHKRHKNSHHSSSFTAINPSCKLTFLWLQCHAFQSSVVHGISSNAVRGRVHRKRSQPQHQIQKCPCNTKRLWDHICYFKRTEPQTFTLFLPLASRTTRPGNSYHLICTSSAHNKAWCSFLHDQSRISLIPGIC